MRKVFFKHGVILLATIFMLVVSGCSGGEAGNTPATETGSNSNTEQNDSGESITLKLGHPAPDQSPTGQAAIAFKEEVEARTNGKVVIEIYPNGILGGTRDLVEQNQQGTLELAVVTAPHYSHYVDEINAISFPFLFENEEQVYRNLDGEFGQTIAQSMESQGFKLLGFWELGFNQVATTDTPIETPDDMKGLKILAHPSKVISDTFSSLGAELVPIDVSEAYTAQQQGVINAQNPDYTAFVDTNGHELSKYFIELNLIYQPMLFTINKGIYDSLDTEIQDLFVELGRHFTDYQREMAQAKKEEAKKFIIDQGVIVMDDLDMQPFVEAVSPVYEKHGKTFQALHDLIQ